MRLYGAGWPGFAGTRNGSGWGVVEWYGTRTGGMTTSPMCRAGLSWKTTTEVLDSICKALDIEWSWDPTRYLVVFQRSRPGDQTAHDLEVCFGDPDYLEFRVTNSVIMRMPEDNIIEMLETWVGRE